MSGMYVTRHGETAHRLPSATPGVRRTGGHGCPCWPHGDVTQRSRSLPYACRTGIFATPRTGFPHSKREGALVPRVAYVAAKEALREAAEASWPFISVVGIQTLEPRPEHLQAVKR